MKRILFVIFIFVTVSEVRSQSPTAFRSLDLVGSKDYSLPVEYNALNA